MKAVEITRVRRELQAADRKTARDWKEQRELERLRREFAAARREQRRGRESK